MTQTRAFAALQAEFMECWGLCSESRRLDLVVGFIHAAYALGAADVRSAPKRARVIAGAARRSTARRRKSVRARA